MKHKKFERIWWSVLFNPILLFITWESFQSFIWKITGDYEDVFARLFHVIGVIAAFIFVNWTIEFTTRIKEDTKGK